MSVLPTAARSCAAAIACCALIACSESSSGDSAQRTVSVQPSTKPTAREACLLKAADTPCDLLTERVIHAAVNASGELKYQTIQVGAPSCNVSWPMGRKISIGGGMELDTDDSVSLSYIQTLGPDPSKAAQRFAAVTHIRSREEQAALDAAVATRVRESKQISSENQAMAQELAREMLKKINYIAIPDLGDAAAWGGTGRFKQLMVLIGTVQFIVSADVANDEATNRDQAVALARTLLEHCE